MGVPLIRWSISKNSLVLCVSGGIEMVYDDDEELKQWDMKELLLSEDAQVVVSDKGTVEIHSRRELRYTRFYKIEVPELILALQKAIKEDEQTKRKEERETDLILKAVLDKEC